MNNEKVENDSSGCLLLLILGMIFTAVILNGLHDLVIMAIETCI